MSFLYNYPEQVNKNNYQKKYSEAKAFYGLPNKVNFCTSCVISNQRPSSSVEFQNDGSQPKKVIAFNQEGICDACMVKKDKQKINWKEREIELRDICDRYRSKNGSYDCLVPGSGGT